MKTRLVLWGIGKVYHSMINLLRFYANAGQIEIVGITAQDQPPFKMLDGYPLMRTEEIQMVDYDYLVIMSNEFFAEIVNIAVSKVHVPREKIVSYHLLEIPYFDFQQYDLIRKQKISIVSNNCWGGVLYNTLNMECISPFKNVSFNSNDYLKILDNLEHYLSLDPVWTGKMQMDANQNKEVPLLDLDDVTIKCNHAPDADTAIQDWKRRRDKFNWDNILVEMYAEDPVTEKRFGEVSGRYKKRICFVPYKTEENYSVTLPLMHDQKKFYEAVNSNARVEKNAVVYHILKIVDANVEYRII